MASPKTYVAIPAYRDSELKKTVDDLFSKANRPEDILVGCFVTCLEDEKELCFPNKHPNVKVLHTTPGNLFSISTCRNLALSFLTEEYSYVLQVDSHMRFEQGWDDFLIESLTAIPDPKAVLSGVTPGYRTKNGFEEILTHLNDTMKVLTYDHEFALKTFMNAYELVPGMSGGNDSLPYEKAWYLSGAFVYSYYDFFIEVPQVNWVYFWGEELMHSARAFTRGWNGYVLKHIPVFHLWREDRSYEGTPVGKIFDDFPNQIGWRTSYTTERCLRVITEGQIGPQSLFSNRNLQELPMRVGYDIQGILKKFEQEYIAQNGSLRPYDIVPPIPSQDIQDRL